MNLSEILTAAHLAAREAIKKELAENPESKEDAFGCGFAWVTIDGTEALARFCREQNKKRENESIYGSKGYPRGWQFWCPGNYNGQAMRIHAKGAMAFAQYLASHNIRSSVGQRLD